MSSPLRLIVLCLLVGLSPAASAADAPAPVSFKRDVAPLLIQHCQTCHGPSKPKGGYRLDTFERLMKPGSSGEPAVTVGKPNQSELYRLLVVDDAGDRMPKKADPLPKAHADLIKAWIEQGAAFDGPDAAADVASYLQSAEERAPEVYKRAVPIAALAFTPDGKELIAGGFHELTRWDARSGKLTGRIPLSVQRVQAIAIDEKSGRVAVAGGTPGVSGELLLLDLAGGSAPRSLEKTPDMMLAARFSPDGSVVAAGGSDGGVRVFETATTKRKWKLEPHADWVTDLAFSPDGKLLATASRDKSCRIFEVKSALAEASYLDHSEPVFAVVFSADGKSVFSAGRDRRLHMWASADAKGQGSTGGIGGDVLRLARRENALYACGGDGRVRVFAADQGVKPPAATSPATRPADEAKQKAAARPAPRVLLTTLDTSPGAWVYSVAVSDRGGLVAAGSHDGTVRVWSADGHAPVTTFVAAPGRD